MPVLVRLVVSQQTRDRAERTLLHLNGRREQWAPRRGVLQAVLPSLGRALAYPPVPFFASLTSRSSTPAEPSSSCTWREYQRQHAQHAACNVQWTTCNVQHATCNMHQDQMHLCESVRELPDQLGRSYDAGVIAVVEDPHQRLSQTH